jgi:hypothetical protein
MVIGHLIGCVFEQLLADSDDHGSGYLVGRGLPGDDAAPVHQADHAAYTEPRDAGIALHFGKLGAKGVPRAIARLGVGTTPPDF